MQLTATHLSLIHRLADGHFYSGQQLAIELGLSRTSVWNYLKDLKGLGFDLHAVKGKGTRLAEPIELLKKQLILDGLSINANALLQRLDLLGCTTSTNSHLVQHSRTQRTANGMVCIAEMQTAGKGRLGRTWVSPFGGNLYMSFLWNFRSGIGALSGLSLACGVAVCEALKNIGLAGHQLKWPNDILCDGKKLGGILVEIQGESQNEYTAVVGIGLNCQMNGDAAKQIDQPWTDLKTVIANNYFSRNQLASELMNNVLPVLDKFEESGLSPFLDKWDCYDGYKNKNIKIISGKKSSTGIAKGITELGELKVLNNAGNLELISSGEVSLRLE